MFVDFRIPCKTEAIPPVGVIVLEFWDLDEVLGDFEHHHEQERKMLIGM